MPQLDKFTYFSQFFWLCLFFFTFYIAICNNGGGLLGISRIMKLRNQLISNQGNNIQSPTEKSMEDLLIKGFSTGVSYMYSFLVEVSQWCNTIHYVGLSLKFTLISYLGGICGLRGIDKNILYLISLRRPSYKTSSSRITLRNDLILIHVLHGQRSIVF